MTRFGDIVSPKGDTPVVKMRLADDGRKGRAIHAPAQNTDHGRVQHDVGHKAGHHRSHGKERAAQVAEHWRKAGREHLEEGAEDDDLDVLLAAVIDRTGRAEQAQQRRVGKPQADGQEDAHPEQHDQRRAQQPLVALPLAPAQADRHVDRSAHADARTDRLQERSHRIGDIDARKAAVPDVAADKKSVHDRVDPRKGKRQHGGQHAAQICPDHPSVSHGSSSSPSRRACINFLLHWHMAVRSAAVSRPIAAFSQA